MAVDHSKIVDLNKRFVSPKGVLEPYAYLNKPDYGRDNFKNERGKYKLALTMEVSDPNVQKLMKFIEDKYELTYKMYLEDHAENPPAVVRGKKALEPYQGELPFVDNGDGTVTFKMDAWASYTDKDKNIKPITLTYADARGKPIKAKDLPNIFGGSTLRASFKVMPYGWSNVAGASVKLQLQGVMLIDVVESSQDGANDFGDYAEDDGYEAGESSNRSEPDDGDFGGDESDMPFDGGSDAAENLGTSGGGDF